MKLNISIIAALLMLLCFSATTVFATTHLWTTAPALGEIGEVVHEHFKATTLNFRKQFTEILLVALPLNTGFQSEESAFISGCRNSLFLVAHKGQPYKRVARNRVNALGFKYRLFVRNHGLQSAFGVLVSCPYRFFKHQQQFAVLVLVELARYLFRFVDFDVVFCLSIY